MKKESVLNWKIKAAKSLEEEIEIIGRIKLGHVYEVKWGDHIVLLVPRRFNQESCQSELLASNHTTNAIYISYAYTTWSSAEVKNLKDLSELLLYVDLPTKSEYFSEALKGNKRLKFPKELKG